MEWEPIITGLSTILGIIASTVINSKMVNYRIGQLEKKVEKHNNVVERMYHLEEEQSLMKQKINFFHHDGGAN